MCCPQCGYSLTALTTPVCPECGARFVITDQTGQTYVPPTPWWRQVISVCYWIGVALVIMSWARLVPATVGWVGFGLTLLAWGVSNLNYQVRRARRK